jgi:hypothetical protein
VGSTASRTSASSGEGAGRHERARSAAARLEVEPPVRSGSSVRDGGRARLTVSDGMTLEIESPSRRIGAILEVEQDNLAREPAPPEPSRGRTQGEPATAPRVGGVGPPA